MSIVDWAALKTTELPSHVDEHTLAVLPIGAIEQHGPHLPLATDTLILQGLLEALRRRRLGTGRALLLPLLPVGHSPEHHGFAGTLSLGAETLLALWGEVGRTVADAGVRRLLFLNSHGGNSALAQVAAMRLRDEAGLLAAVLTTHSLGAPDGMLDADEARFGIHAGHAETALVQALAPELVDRDAARVFASRERDLAGPLAAFTGRIVRIAWRAEDLSEAGALGDATAATPDDGRRLLAFLTDRVVEAFEAMIAWPLPATSGVNR